VAIIREGRIVAVESVDTLPRRHVHTVELVLARPAAEGTFDLADVDVVATNGVQVRLLVRGDLNPLLRRLGSVDVRDMAVTTPDLEEVFLTYYGSTADADRAETA
jgi:ABC-2 type transport system ATP-binding protein